VHRGYPAAAGNCRIRCLIGGYRSNSIFIAAPPSSMAVVGENSIGGFDRYFVLSGFELDLGWLPPKATIG
jgi:hypothetical protein